MVLRTRLELSDILHNIPGVAGVYYASGPSQKMRYPCIRYKLSGVRTSRADNIPYVGAKVYELTLIDEDPDSKILDEMLMLPYCSFDRSFIADGLNHYVFTIFF